MTVERRLQEIATAANQQVQDTTTPVKLAPQSQIIRRYATHDRKVFPKLIVD
jgi:hypothetical protein